MTPPAQIARKAWNYSGIVRHLARIALFVFVYLASAKLGYLWGIDTIGRELGIINLFFTLFAGLVAFWIAARKRLDAANVIVSLIVYWIFGMFAVFSISTHALDTQLGCYGLSFSLLNHALLAVMVGITIGWVVSLKKGENQKPRIEPAESIELSDAARDRRK